MKVRGKRWLAPLILVAIVASLLAVVVASPASAAACYGSTCNGKNPDGLCSGDAITVRSMDVRGEGMLQLRYSPSCKANWGKFWFYWRTEAGYLLSDVHMHARVTVWNPGKTSYGTAHYATGLGGSYWSYMTNGILTACTGVEIVHVVESSSGSTAIDEIEKFWTWGPCY